MKIACTILKLVAFCLVCVPVFSQAQAAPRPDAWAPAMETFVAALSGGDTSLRRAPVRKFADALRRHDASLASSPDHRDVWASFMRDLPMSGRLRTLEAVNGAVNGVRYAADGAEDAWTAPAEFLRRGSGDCEDYALAKYAALRALGISAEDMAIMVFVAPDIGAHAVLVVSEGRDLWVLDNRRPEPTRVDRTVLGRVTYLVNENGTDFFLRSRLTSTASGAR